MIYVYGKKDKDAVSHITPEVKNIKDKENFSDIEGFAIYLSGINDPVPKESPVLKVERVNKKRVRNARLEEIRNAIERAKFRFILDIYFDGEKYILGKKTNFLDWKFGDDVSYCFFEEFPTLILHRRSEDIIYSGDKVVGKIDRNTGEIKVGEIITYPLEWKNYFEIKLNTTLKEMQKFCDREIAVPWSGGKDSTAVILLCKKIFKSFTPVFVNTGNEFEETLKYIENFGVKYETVETKIIPGPNCKTQKVTALYNFIEKNFENPLIMVGDRITESKSRSLRPQHYKDKFEVFAPIKYWSIIDIQLLFKIENKELHPLYKKGVFRIGCKNCPYMDYYSKIVIKK
jgi:hypothetical protein